MRIEQWTLVPELEMAHDLVLAGVGDIRLAESGEIYVSTLSPPSQILAFSPTGELLRRMGHQGPGPGEFQVLGNIGAIGDSVYGVDMNWSQVSLFDAHGFLLEAWRVQPPDSTSVYNYPAALFSDGTALVPTTAWHSQTTYDRLILRTRWGGSSPDTIVRIPRRQTAWRLGPYQTSQPFAQDARYGISPDGQFIAVVDVDADSVGSDSVRVTLRRLDKSLVYQRKVPFAHERITRHIRDSVLANRVRVLHRVSEQQIRAGLFVPGYMVPVSHVLVGTDGSVWLEAARKSAGFTWLVVNPEGYAQATVTVPPGTHILTIDRGICGYERDDDGIPTVIRWRAEPSP